MANALSQDPGCLEQIEEEKAVKISVLSGESLESPEKVKWGDAFRYFSIIYATLIDSEGYE